MMHDILREKPILRRRSLTIGGSRTSVTLEDVFWHRLKEVAKVHDMHVNALCRHIDVARGDDGGLSGAIRCFLMEQALAENEALKKAIPY